MQVGRSRSKGLPAAHQLEGTERTTKCSISAKQQRNAATNSGAKQCHCASCVLGFSSILLFHIADEGLPTVVHMDVQMAPAITQPPKDLNLGCTSPRQTQKFVGWDAPTTILSFGRCIKSERHGRWGGSILRPVQQIETLSYR